MSQISQILDEKGRDVLEIEAGASVFDAVKRMVEGNVGSLLVKDGDAVAGIVTERDYLRRVVLAEKADRDTPVREIMTSPLIVVGMVSIGDLVKFKSKQQSFEIQYLTDYIPSG